VHVICVAASIVGFVTRFVLASRGSPLIRHRFVRIAPHVNDTLLLAAAIAMLLIANLDPLSLAWLRAKLVGLVGYVMLGMMARRPQRSQHVRLLAFAGALLMFGYVVTVALTKSPLGALWGLAQA
jgi:uncharacterized membrane protein SirB2